MEHMFLCLFHASEECHGSRRLPCSAFAPIVVRDRVTLSCSVSAKRYSVFHTTNSGDKCKVQSAKCRVLLFVIVVSSGRRVMMPSSTHHGGLYLVALQLRVCRSAANRTRFLCKGIHNASRRLVHFICEDVQSDFRRTSTTCMYICPCKVPLF